MNTENTSSIMPITENKSHGHDDLLYSYMTIPQLTTAA